MCSMYSIHKAWQLQAQHFACTLFKTFRFWTISVEQHCGAKSVQNQMDGWRSRWGKHRDHQYGARNRMHGWDGQPCGRVSLEGTNTVLKKSRTPAGHGECLSRGSRRLLRIFKLIVWRIEIISKEISLKRRRSRNTFSFSPRSWSNWPSAVADVQHFMSDRLIPLVNCS